MTRMLRLVVVVVLWAAVAAPAPASGADTDELARSIDRLYRAFFQRGADGEGFTHWYCLVSKGRRTLGEVADDFVASAEFRSDFGDLDGVPYLELAYEHVFERPLDESGRAYWLDQMAAGMTRGRVMAHLASSDEFRATTADEVPPPVDPALVAATTCGPVLLVAVPRGLPDGYAASVVDHPEVEAASVVHGDLARLVATHDADGAVVDAPAPGWAWPMEAIAVDPVSYADLVGGPGRDVVAGLQPGQAILSETSAALRRLGPGGILTFETGRVTVLAVVPDRSVSAAEIVVHRADAPLLGIDTERFLLLRDTDRPAVEAAAREALPEGRALTLFGSADVRFLRDAARVDPFAHTKAAYGEFRFQDLGGRDIRIDPAWVDATIVTATVPLLGRIRCHRAIVPRVRAALAEVEAAGAGGSIDPADYAGCFAPRRIQPGEGLSRHAWGIALDINVDGDPRGDYATQHPALVAAMRRQGFFWGGDWDNADPAHYEAMGA